MKRKISIIILIVMLMTSCAPQYKGTFIDSGSTIENMVEEETLEKERIKLFGKERFDKDYGNGAYLKDYSEVKSRLNEEAKVYMGNMFSEYDKEYEYYKMNVDLFHTFYDQVQSENMSFEDIIINHADWIDELELIMLIFTDSDLSNDEYPEFFYDEYIFFNEQIFEKVEEIYDFSFHIYFSEDTFETDEIKELFYDKGVIPFLSLLSKNGYDSEYNQHGYSSKSLRRFFLPQTENRLEDSSRLINERYNKKFLFIKSDKSVTNMYHDVPYYAPLEDTNIVFEGQYFSDEYLRVVVENHIVNQVQQIIDDFGVGDIISPFVVSLNCFEPKKMDNFSPEYLQSKSKNFIALYYVIGEEETYDYELMYELILEVQKVIYKKPNDNDKIYLKLFKAEKDNALTFHKLLQENPLTENYDRSNGLFGTMEISSNSSEAFDFLWCYATQEAFMYKYYGPIKEGMDIEQFKKLRKAENEFKRWEDEKNE